jgi:hypothetical protein
MLFHGDSQSCHRVTRSAYELYGCTHYEKSITIVGLTMAYLCSIYIVSIALPREKGGTTPRQPREKGETDPS